MEISPQVKELLEKIYSDPKLISSFGQRSLERVRKEPEVHLLSLLIAIAEELPDITSTLRSTVRMGIFDTYENKARALLAQGLD